MSSLATLREPARTIALPPNVPASAILGQRGKLVSRIRQLTGAAIRYRPEDHRVDINGSPRDAGAAARLLERTLEHYQYSGAKSTSGDSPESERLSRLAAGLQFSRKQISNVLGPELSNAASLQLLPCSRPVRTLLGPVDAFVLSPVPGGGSLKAGAAAATAAAPAAGIWPPAASAYSDRDQPDASTSAASQTTRGSSGPGSPLLQLSSDFDTCLQQLVDMAAEISVRHPADCDHTEIRLYLGKLMLTDLVSSARIVSPEVLSGWSFQRNARTVFETSLPQETIRSLDKYLTSIGFTPTQQIKSASLHLESSISWIQYHPTFSVGPDGELRLAKLETLGCKPLTVALVGPPDRTDVRLRYVASVQHGDEDPVAAELRRRQSEFALVNNVQVIVPNDLHIMDLTLTSARVKLKRVYTTPGPLPPLGSSPASASASASTSTPAAPTRRARTSKRATGTTTTAAAASGASASSADPGLPPVSLKVSVAAVVDNLGGKRLEVTVSCPELNATLMGLHRNRVEARDSRQLLAAQLRSLLAHVDELRRNVEFQP